MTHQIVLLETVIGTHKMDTLQVSVSEQFLGDYKATVDFDPNIDHMMASVRFGDNDVLIADIQYVGKFKMVRLGSTKYRLEDMKYDIEFSLDETGKATFNFLIPLILEEVNFINTE